MNAAPAKTAQQLLEEAKELLIALHNALQVANAVLARCDRMAPDPACARCSGCGHVEYSVHGDLISYDCSCRKMTIKLPITI